MTFAERFPDFYASDDGTPSRVVELGADHGFQWTMMLAEGAEIPEGYPWTVGDDGLIVGGIIEWHPSQGGDRYTEKGELCGGGVQFLRFRNPSEREAKRHSWSVESTEPLTISPSVLCSCGSHGWIKAGRWIPV